MCTDEIKRVSNVARSILNVQIFSTILVKLKMIDLYSYVSVDPMSDERLNRLSIEFCEALADYWNQGDITQEQWQDLGSLSELAHDGDQIQSSGFWHREVSNILRHV